MDVLTCFNCDRPIRDSEGFKQVPGVTAGRGTLIQHTTCPPGKCASCGTERPYVELSPVPEMDDPDLLSCDDVRACQIRSGELDPDD